LAGQGAISSPRTPVPRGVCQLRSTTGCAVHAGAGPPAAAECRDRPQPGEDRSGARQREGLPEDSGGVRLIRPVHLGIRGRAATAGAAPPPGRHPGEDSRLGGDEQGARPHGALLPPPAARRAKL